MHQTDLFHTKLELFYAAHCASFVLQKHKPDRVTF